MAQENKFIKSLIQSAQNGNSAALEQLFEMNIARVYGICLRILGNTENAEAVTVLVFIEAWKQIKFIRPDISFTEWLCSMAVWNSLELIRSGDNSNKAIRKKKKNEHEVNSHLDEFDEVLIKLPDKERLPFVLFNIEGYREVETCDMLSIKPHDLKKKLETAAKHIAKHASKINSAEEIPTYLSGLSKEIKPVKNLKKVIFDDIYELKLKEFEKNKKPEPVPEPEPEPEIPKKKKEKKPKKEKPKKQKELKLRTSDLNIIPKLKKVSFVVVPIAILAIIIYFGLLISVSSWDVRIINGTAKINDSEMNEDGSLSLDDVLTTGDNSKAVVSISGIGEIEIGPNTIFKRTNETESCGFEKGQIIARLINRDDLFTVKIPGTDIKDYKPGNTYSLKKLDDGRYKLDVIKGWMEAKSKHNRSIIPQNYFLYITESGGCGLPCPQDATPEIKNMISEYSLQGNAESVLGSFINLADKSEAISLWNLLPRLNPLIRGAVFDKMNELIGIPKSVTKNGTIDLDNRMMNLWFKKIQSELL